MSKDEHNNKRKTQCIWMPRQFGYFILLSGNNTLNIFDCYHPEHVWRQGWQILNVSAYYFHCRVCFESALHRIMVTKAVCYPFEHQLEQRESTSSISKWYRKALMLQKSLRSNTNSFWEHCNSSNDACCRQVKLIKHPFLLINHQSINGNTGLISSVRTKTVSQASFVTRYKDTKINIFLEIHL